VANTFAPFGRARSYGAGAARTHEQTSAPSSNTTEIIPGDLVFCLTNSVTGNIKQATASAVTILGTFCGSKYLSVGQKCTVGQRYWLGSDPHGDFETSVITDSAARFKVQAGNNSTSAIAVNASILGRPINLAEATFSAEQTQAARETPETAFRRCTPAGTPSAPLRCCASRPAA
jgi:hypothetical protein